MVLFHFMMPAVRDTEAFSDIKLNAEEETYSSCRQRFTSKTLYLQIICFNGAKCAGENNQQF